MSSLEKYTQSQQPENSDDLFSLCDRTFDNVVVDVGEAVLEGTHVPVVGQILPGEWTGVKPEKIVVLYVSGACGIAVLSRPDVLQKTSHWVDSKD